MDTEVIKVLLDSQEKTFHTAMDFVVDQFKSRIREAEVTIQDLTRSLEFSQAEVKDLQSEVKELRKFASEILKSQIKDLEQRQNYQEDYNRRNNLRISGIEEKLGETWEETAIAVSKLIEEKLQLPAVKLEHAHRTGRVLPSRSRVVVARFEKFSDREAVMRNARKLKGSEIYIDEDLCPASQEIRKSQIPLMKKARKEGKIPFFKHTRLIIKDKSTKYQLQGRSSGSEGVSTREAVGDVTGAMHQASEASGGESSVGAEGGNNYASTRGAVGHVSEAVVQTNEANGGESSVGGEGGSTGGPYSAHTGSSGVGGGSGSCHGRPTPSGTGGGEGSPDAAPTQRQQQTSRTRNRRK